MVVSPPPFTTRPELQGHLGMVASTHYLASAAGMAALESGGNAVDAAVTAGFVLQVVEPHLNGPGGDMSLIVAPAGSAPAVLCGQGPAPRGATIDEYTSRGLDHVPGSGLLAAAVPGATVAWFTLLRDHGTIDVAAALEPAIGYAERGFPVLPAMTITIAAVADLMAAHWPASAAQYLPGGTVPQPGGWLTNPALAATYRRLVRAAAGHGRERGCDTAIRAWSEGFVAEAIDAFCRIPVMDSTGRRYDGVLTAGDLAAWAPSYEVPAVGWFGDHTVAKVRPWGQGPVLLQQLAMLDGADLADDSAGFVHTVVEAAKLALADREAHYGDSGDGPLGALVADLLAEHYTAARRGLIGTAASLEWRPGSPGGRRPMPPRHATTGPDVSGTAGEPAVPDARPGDTCHVDVVDRWGTMVSATPSGGWLQSSPLIPALGFPLGTRLQMMTLQPGLPTSLRPGRRPRTTLSPTLVLAGDTAVLACGTPGGDQQDQWQTPFLIRHLAFGQNLQQAIDAPTFHTTHVPSSFHPHEAHPGQIVIEDRFDAAVLADLRGRGHRVVASGPWSLGRLSAVARDPGSGVLRAAANPRGMQGYAVGR